MGSREGRLKVSSVSADAASANLVAVLHGISFRLESVSYDIYGPLRPEEALHIDAITYLRTYVMQYRIDPVRDELQAVRGGYRACLAPPLLRLGALHATTRHQGRLPPHAARGPSVMSIVEIRHWHMCFGLGGGAKGFNQGEARV